MSLLTSALNRDTLRRASGHLTLALALVAIGAAALGLARWDLGQTIQQRNQAQVELDALQAESDQLGASLQMLEDNIDRFRSLQREGFVGGGDRIAWTEALMRVRQRLQLPDTAFELAPQQMLEPPAGDPNLIAEAAPPPPSGPLAHDLRIQVTGLHEGELLDLLDSLRDERVGHFRAQACELSRDVQVDGLQLDCTLRFVTYLPPPVDALLDDADAEEAP